MSHTPPTADHIPDTVRRVGVLILKIKTKVKRAPQTKGTHTEGVT